MVNKTSSTLFFSALLILLVGLGTSLAMADADDITEPVSIAGKPINYNFIIRNDPETESSPAIAYNPDRQEYLVVWYNDRPGNDDIRAQRVSKTGQLVGGSFYISAGAGHERRFPDVAYNSQQQQYLVVWWNENHSAGWYSIQARRVSATGEVIDPVDIEIVGESNLNTPGKPVVAYAATANKYLVVYQNTFHPTPLQHDIDGQLVLSSGQRDGSPFVISDDPGNGDYRLSPDVAYNQSRNEFLVVWQQRDHTLNQFNVYARRVQGNGTPLQPEYIEIDIDPSDQVQPQVAAIPTEAHYGQYLVVYEDHTYAGDSDIYAQRVKGEGVTDGSLFSVSQANEDQVNPSVTGGDQNLAYLVAWTQTSLPPLAITSIHGQEVTMDGNLKGEDWSLGGLAADHAAVAGGGLDFLTVFDDPGLPSNRGIYGQFWGNRIYLPLIVK